MSSTLYLGVSPCLDFPCFACENASPASSCKSPFSALTHSKTFPQCVFEFSRVLTLSSKTNTEITWGITLVLMFRSVGSILFGIAADRYGRKWPFIVNNVLFIILELVSEPFFSSSFFRVVFSLLEISFLVDPQPAVSWGVDRWTWRSLICQCQCQDAPLALAAHVAG